MRCEYCDEQISVDDGEEYVEADGCFWHPDCLTEAQEADDAEVTDEPH